MSISIVAGKLVVDNYGDIRMTGDGWISVLDLIQVCAEYKREKSRYDVWYALCSEHPDVSEKTAKHKFQGRGQKETPICSKETALEIIGLLPGKAGKKYRALAAKLVLAYLESPDELAKAAIGRIEDPQKLQEVADTARAKYLAKGYHPAMEEIKERADNEQWVYIKVNQETTKAVLGDTPKNLLAKHEQETGKKLKSSRQLPLAQERLNLFENCHSIQAASLKAKEIRGAKPVAEECTYVANEFAEFLRKVGL